MGGTSRRPERAPCAHDATPSPSVTDERLRTAQAPPGRLRVPPRPRARPLSSQDSLSWQDVFGHRQSLDIVVHFCFSGKEEGRRGRE